LVEYQDGRSRLVDISKHNPKLVLVAGDWHRNPHAAFPKKVVELAKSLQIDTILHVGDFGYKYGSTDAYMFEKPLHRALLEADVKLVWVDGNHENHPMLNELPRLDNGFVQTGARGNIFYAPRGHRWEWSGRRFGALGGAWSPNWAKLKEGRTLFLELEQPTWADLELLGDNPLDYLVTHDVPERLAIKSPFGLPTKTVTREILQQAVDRTNPKRIFSGHWHQRLDYRLPLLNGSETFGHILNREWNADNVLILDLEHNEILPLPNTWTTTKKEIQHVT
jgi:hypothetical protein